MTFTDAVRACLRNYFAFSGRASRAEYWYFVLFIFLGSIVTGLLDGLIFGAAHLERAQGSIAVENNGPITSLFNLAVLVPAISAGWRRMHDTGRSGLYLLYPLLVILGMFTFAGLVGGFEPLMQGNFGTLLAGGSAVLLGIAMFVFFLSPLFVIWWLTRPSDAGENAYGPPPARKG